MSFVIEDQKKNVFQVSKTTWAAPTPVRFMAWYISNSISKHTQQETASLPEAEFVAELKMARINVAFADLSRTNAMAFIEDNFQDFNFMPFIKVRPLQSRYFEYLLAQDIYICTMR